MTKPLLILIAGPYRSGTGNQPHLMAANLRRLEDAAWPIFEAGHIPMIGEWVALPILAALRFGNVEVSPEDILYPTARRLLDHCDAVLRLPGESTGADADVAIARRRGLPVYFRPGRHTGPGRRPRPSVNGLQRDISNRSTDHADERLRTRDTGRRARSCAAD